MNWNDLSRYRAPLMGFAMIIVMLFHVPLSRSDLFYGLMRCGNNGVDMFLFLSGIGLWFSWTKKAHPMRNDSSLFTLHSSLSWFGSISAMLFVMHPIARELIISHYRRIDIYGGIFIYLLSSVALAMLLKWILQFIPNPKS